jgi:hypothetical protein
MSLRTIFVQRLADAERALAQLPPLPRYDNRDKRDGIDELAVSFRFGARS